MESKPDRDAPSAGGSVERASPVCYAAQADPAYMGQVTHEELLASLNELLEAERAGARVAEETLAQLQDPAERDLMEVVRKGEVKWCGMLMSAIKSLDAKPSTHVGAFHGKAMAIADLTARMVFLNRGQAWVVRKLEALVPKVGQPQIQENLLAMLVSHRENIDRVATRLADAAGS